MSDPGQPQWPNQPQRGPAGPAAPVPQYGVPPTPPQPYGYAQPVAVPQYAAPQYAVPQPVPGYAVPVPMAAVPQAMAPQQPYYQQTPQAYQPQAYQTPQGYGAPPGMPQAVPTAAYPAAMPTAYAAPVPTYPPAAYAQPVAAPVPVAPQAAPVPTPGPVVAPQTARPTSPAPTAQRPTAARPLPVPAGGSPAAAAQATTALPTTTKGGKPLPIPVKPIPVKPKSDVAIVAADPEEEEKPAEIVTTKKASPWLISMVVHMVIILILALIFIPIKYNPAIELVAAIYAEEEGVQLENEILDSGIMDPTATDAALSIDIKAVDDPLAAPPEILDLNADAAGAISEVKAPSIGMALTGREAGMKKALLGAYGGTVSTEEAVKAGLKWLAKNQRPDGTWSLSGPYSGGAQGENVTSATAMALLAFQGAGHTPVEGEHKKIVDKGWKAMLKMQDRDGNFVQEAGFNQHLYAQAQATIAICELFGMTKDSRYAVPAELAIKYALKAQAPEGGWRYNPGSDTDTSVTGWFVMALQSAKMSGMEVPQTSLDKINGWLDAVATEDGSRYRYQRGRQPDHTMTAEALLCRQYLGWQREDERLQRGCQFVATNPVDYSQQNVYYWYYATQTMHHMEGEYWNNWNKVMRQAIPERQEKSGKEEGSWSPASDEWGHHGGRLYVTCLSIYMLEVYYRHLPIYGYRIMN